MDEDKEEGFMPMLKLMRKLGFLDEDYNPTPNFKNYTDNLIAMEEESDE